jgi:hypothetical protein
LNQDKKFAHLTPNQIVSTPSKEQYIIDAEGTKTAIVLPIDLYEQLLEDLHDLAVVAERKSETPVSLSQMKEWLTEDGTL